MPCRVDIVPDFIVQIDDGGAEPLNLILETKGYRGADAQLKAETMKKLWVPGVNNLGTMGRWAFAEFTDVFEIQTAFDALVEFFAPSISGENSRKNHLMARGPSKTSNGKSVSSLTHEGAARKNIPTAEYQSVAEHLEGTASAGACRLSARDAFGGG